MRIRALDLNDNRSRLNAIKSILTINSVALDYIRKS